MTNPSSKYDASGKLRAYQYQNKKRVKLKGLLMAVLLVGYY